MARSPSYASRPHCYEIGHVERATETREKSELQYCAADLPRSLSNPASLKDLDGFICQVKYAYEFIIVGPLIATKNRRGA